MRGPDSIKDLRRLVGEDPCFQRRFWAMQRCGWVGMASFVLLAAAGGLGRGPLSGREVTSADGALRIQYDAVARQDSATRWSIALPPGARSVTIASAALSWLEPTNIRPAPLRERRGHAALTLDVALPSDGAALLVLTIEPTGPGLAAVRVHSGNSEATIRLLVLP